MYLSTVQKVFILCKDTRVHCVNTVPILVLCHYIVAILVGTFSCCCCFVTIPIFSYHLALPQSFTSDPFVSHVLSRDFLTLRTLLFTELDQDQTLLCTGFCDFVHSLYFYFVVMCSNCQLFTRPYTFSAFIILYVTWLVKSR